MIAWKTKGTQVYQSLPKECHESLKPCEPLREMPENRLAQEKLFEVWKAIKGEK